MDLKNREIYNRILVEFDFIVDLDLAMFKLIRDKYNNPELVDQDIINMRDENEVIKLLLNRNHINVLETLIPNKDTLGLYQDLLNNHLDELLEYAQAYDTFALMITFLKEASSISITVLCKNKTQEDFIHSLNASLNTVVIRNKKDVVKDVYDVFYLKYYASALEYINIKGKHIYIANAKFNMDEEKKSLPNLAISAMVSDVNLIHTIDLYKTVKYRRIKENE